MAAGAPVLQGAPWRAPSAEPAPRWSMMPLLVALALGVSAGFGLGYWAAWRSAVREQTAIVRTPPAADSGTVARVDEPQVKPEAPAAASAPATPAPAASAHAQSPAPEPPAPAPERERPHPRKEASAPPGKLLIRSTPPGARVAVDGRARGRTPLILRDMPLRVMTVTVTQPGYKPNEQRVALSAARPTATVDAHLTQEAAAAETASQATTGSLYVESRPSSAQVFVDNRSIGMTPISIPELSPGYHRVRLELAGFSPWVTMAEVRVGARTRVSASLEQGTPQ
jgi:hypothetical protein